MKIKRTLGPKGQIVVPKDIREYLGLGPGSPVTFEVRGRELVIQPDVDPEKFVEEFGSAFPNKFRKKIDVKELLEKRFEEEYGIR